MIIEIKKKNICLIIPSLQTGGMERVMSELATYFSAKPALNVHLLMYGLNPDIIYEIPDNIIIHRPSFRFNNKIRIWHTIRTMYFLRKSVTGIKPDAILSFGEYWNSFVLIALAGVKKRIFVSDRCQPDKSLGKVHDFLRKILYPQATGVIVQTTTAKEIYDSQLHKVVTSVIGNPIKTIKSTTEIPKENIILSVGRLIRSKHHDLLISMFVNVNIPGWKLVIVGDDALKQKNKENLEKLISELHASDRVILTGSLPEVDNLYLKSKIFAFTSGSEGFPNVVGEAMAAGLPVIAFDCIAGPSEMIENGKNGYLVPLFDHRTFEQRLKDLMLDESLRRKLGAVAKESIKRFHVNEIGDQYLKTLIPSL